MSWVWNNADKLGNLSQVLVAMTAIGAVFFTYLQIRSATISQREATAKNLYREYLLLAFKHPELATPEDDTKLIASDKYRWFVAVLLNCCDEILAGVGHDPVWRDVIIADLEYHLPCLKSKFFLDNDQDRGWSLYSGKLEYLFNKAYP